MSRKIILNNSLVFEPDKKRIIGKGNPAVISASASLCLELLIDNVGQLVTHQQFYDYVWRRFGTEPSPTTLYQNISALRRAFDKAGLHEDIIRTMPRKGFLLSPKITVHKENISPATPEDVTIKGVHSSPVQGDEMADQGNFEERKWAVKNEKEIYRGNNHVFLSFFFKCRSCSINLLSKKFIVLLSLVALTVFFVILMLGGEKNEGGPMFTYSTKYKGCVIFSSTDALLNTAEVIKKIEQLNINCNLAPYIYLTAYKNADGLSYFKCQHQLKSSQRANCNSFYYIKKFNDE